MRVFAIRLADRWLFLAEAIEPHHLGAGFFIVGGGGRLRSGDRAWRRR
jgi:hypothetical protein